MAASAITHSLCVFIHAFNKCLLGQLWDEPGPRGWRYSWDKASEKTGSKQVSMHFQRPCCVACARREVSTVGGGGAPTGAQVSL